MYQEVVTLNVTFAAHSSEALKELQELISQHSSEDQHLIVTGVFPMAMCAAIARAGIYASNQGAMENYFYSTGGEYPPMLRGHFLVPVMVQAEAVEGGVRPMVHSHWEYL